MSEDLGGMWAKLGGLLPDASAKQIAQQQAQSRSRIDAIVDDAAKYATQHVYSGPTSSEMLCGWPLVPLLSAIGIPHNSPDFGAVVATIKHKYGPLRPHLPGAGAQGVANAPSNRRPHSCMEMLRVRLGLDIKDNHIPGFFHVAAIVHDETVHVWVITNSSSVTLEDEAAMFPSDALLTKLRLLQETPTS